MNIRLSQSEFCLSKRQTLSLVGAAGFRIDAHAGTVWVTQDHDRRDVVLSPGESFTLDGPGQAIVQAFEPSRVSLTQPTAEVRRTPALDWAPRLADALRRLLPRPAWA